MLRSFLKIRNYHMRDKNKRKNANTLSNICLEINRNIETERSEKENLSNSLPKTARKQIYNEMKPYLTHVSIGYLQIMTCKARKINKLFGYKYDPITLKKIK
ncbi:8737_t:CDS:2, partial [Funneliformis geosporum]